MYFIYLFLKFLAEICKSPQAGTEPMPQQQQCQIPNHCATRKLQSMTFLKYIVSIRITVLFWYPFS